MAGLVLLKYRAFLSYAHADEKWARWLHGRLEGFRIERDLVGRPTRLRPVPKTLRPVFLDRGNFAGGHSLTEATIAALDLSGALIVLCSSASAASVNVNEEVRLFRHRHPRRPVIPVIIEGAAPASFPPALRLALDPDGTVGERPMTILGPDLRDSGDGRELGLAKVVAGLLGFDNADDIYRRARRAAARASWIRTAVAALFLAVAAIGGYFSWDSQQKGTVLVQNAAELSAIRAIADKMLAANPAAAATPGAADNLVATLTSIQQQVAAGDGDYAKANELLKAGKGAEAVPLLIAAAEAKKRRAATETKASAKAYREAAAIAEVAEPGKARELYAEAARLDPDDVEGMFQNAWFQREAGALAEAERGYGRVLALGKLGTDDDSLIWAHFGLGDILAARGQLEPAKAEYRLGQNAADRLARSAPGNAGWQFDFGISNERIGNVLVAQGNLPEALKAYQSRQESISRLASSDPGNAGWQRDLSVSYDRTGDVLVAQGDLTGALKAYRDSLAIRDRLARSDPGNAGWQRDLSVSQMKVADVASKSGDKATARVELAAAREISARLAKLSPDNVVWKKDLAWIDAQLAALGR